MINNKNNWYLDALSTSEIIHEAGVTDSLKSITWAIALLLMGNTIASASEETGVPVEQISQALQNKELVNRVEEQFSNSQNPEVKEKLPKIDFFEIEKLIRLHEVSGKKREVVVNGKTIDIRKVYPDPIYGMKVPTIGIGYNLNREEARQEISSLGLDYEKIRNGTQMLTDEQVDILYRNDIAKAIANARIFLPNFDKQPTQVKTVLVDMSFNLGLTRLLKFKKFKSALLRLDYNSAANEMIDSNWYRQVGERARRNVETIRGLVPLKKDKKPELIN